MDGSGASMTPDRFDLDALDPQLQRHCGIPDLIAWNGWVDGVLAQAGTALGPCPLPLLRRFALPLLQRLHWLRQDGRRPVIGLNGPVGAGKSSLAAALLQLAPALGLELAVASIDDFYLPWQERCRAMAGNPFGVTRVPPGSHDPVLLQAVLADWRAGAPLRLPRFDKTLQGGEGDRCGERLQRADALVLEGWLLGCRPLGADALALALQAEMAAAERANGDRSACGGAWWSLLSPAERAWLPRWDRELQAYQSAWQLLDELWLLRPQHWGLPRRWRFQAEARQRRRLRAVGEERGWLAPAALDNLVRASLCSLPPALYQDPLLPRGGDDNGSQPQAGSQGNTGCQSEAGRESATGCQSENSCHNKTIQPCPTAVEGRLDGRRRLLAVRCWSSAVG